jgi:hypothetical protein
MILSWWIFLVLFSEVSLVKFSGTVDSRIRSKLLEALRRFHTKAPPLVLSVPMTSVFGISTVPRLVFSKKYFDFRSLCSLVQTNTNWSSALIANVNHHLHQISPHFVTDDQLVNNLLFSVLNEHFDEFSNLQRLDDFKDRLLLLSLKFTENDFSFKTIPRNLYYYIICFLHEIAYGDNAVIVPLTVEQCTLQFLRLAKLGVKLPRSYDRLLELESATKHIAFIYESGSNMSKDDIKLHFNFQAPFDFDLFKNLDLPLQFKVYIIESLIDEVENVHIYSLIHIFSLSDVFSQPLWDRVMLSRPSQLDYTGIISPSIGIKLFKYKSKAASRLHSLAKHVHDKLFYKTCSLEVVDFSRFSSFPSMDHLSGFVRVLIDDKSHSLAQLDAFSKLIRFGRFDMREMNRFLREVCEASNTFLFEILVKDSPVPLNMFYSERSVSESFNTVWSLPRCPDHFFVLAFMELLDKRNDNPLIFLTMSFELLQALKPVITDRYDLNRIFTFDDLTMADLSKFKLNPRKMIDLLDQEVSFKDIVNHFDMPLLKEIFSSDPSVFDSQQSILSKRTRPTSVSYYEHFFYFIQDASYLTEKVALSAT